MSRITVLIADDHEIVRGGLRQLIENQPDMEVVGEAADSMETLEKVRGLGPDVVLLDISMPRVSGLEAIRLIKEAVPNVRIVVLTMYEKESFVHQALAAGAVGYVLKASSTSDVIHAVQAAYRGEYFLSGRIRSEVIAGYLNSQDRKNTMSKYDLLSEREQQVFRLLVEGNTTGEIADVLCVSPKTVEKHRTNITKKLGIYDLVSMVKFAVKIGIVDPDLWIG